jgi:hypothetical protein
MLQSLWNRSSIVLHLLVELRERLLHPARPLLLSAAGREWRTEHGALLACTAQESVGCQGTQRGAYGGAPFGAWSRGRTDRFAPPRRPSREGCVGAGAGLAVSTTTSIFMGRPGRKCRGGSVRTRGHSRPSINLPSYFARATAASPER